MLVPVCGVDDDGGGGGGGDGDGEIVKVLWLVLLGLLLVLVAPGFSTRVNTRATYVDLNTSCWIDQN